MTTTTLLPGAHTETLLTDWRAAARIIDHTLLRPDATAADVRRTCDEALFYSLSAVFVHPSRLAMAAALLRGSGVKPAAPVGYPTGDTLTSVKRFEAEELLKLGAQELDMVLNISALKSGERALVQNDIAAVVEVGHAGGAIVKVILETPLLTIEEKILACQLALAAEADFVKTATGTAGGGATVDDIALMRGVVGERAGVKAAGGIRTAAQMTAMLHAGANRIGCSAPAAILRELGAPEFAGATSADPNY